MTNPTPLPTEGGCFIFDPKTGTLKREPPVPAPPVEPPVKGAAK